ncbi:MAG: DUF4928 family protein, partial [Thermodesulfobacteriota bacterium]
MKDKRTLLAEFARWYGELPVYKQTGGPARGTLAAALVLLEKLRDRCDLNIDSHRAAGKSQIKGASGKAAARILAKLGETRPFLSEGGRTNRGAPGDLSKMLNVLSNQRLDKLSIAEMNQVLTELQLFIRDKVQAFHSRQRLKFVYDPSKSTWQLIQDLMVIAKGTGKEGPVAQYLVGAKLQLRFPNVDIGNDSYSTADEQLGRHGDYRVGDTAFHVTVAPMPSVYERCMRNLSMGLRVYLLVPYKS